MKNKSKVKILQILNSDFGKRNTMGYRAYQISKNSSHNITIFCRANFSDLKSGQIFTPFPFFRTFSRFVQLILQQFKYGSAYLLFRKIEVGLYNYFAKLLIDKHEAVHFFFHSLPLVEYARQQGKIIFIEAFTHPNYVRSLYGQGIKLDTKEFIPDDYSANSYPLANIIISPSSWVSQTLKEADLPDLRVKLIPYGVHPQKDRIYSRATPLKLMFAGGLKRTKGIIDLLKAIKRLGSCNVRMSIFGRPYASVDDEIRLLELDPKIVTFRGYCDSILKEYQKHDVYVYPTYFEGSSKTVFEAMSFGLPIITTKNAGSIVRDGKDGFIVAMNDSEELLEKINFYINNPDQVKKMGRTAQDYSRRYTWKKYARAVLNVYAQAGDPSNATSLPQKNF
jgi:glycosyltransferase involved in cell wall biosynthesis